jgi:hypothetical protein
VNRHINPTDVCVASCKLCAFGKRAKDPKAYTMSLEEVWEKAGHGYTEAVTEFHIVGGLHPELTLDWYCQMLRGLKQRFPQVHLESVHDGRDRIPFAALEARHSRDSRKVEGSRNGFATLAAAAEIFTIACDGLFAITRSRAISGSTCARRRISWDCIRIAPCCTATSRPKRIASIT